MKIKFYIFTLLLLITTSVFADEQDSVVNNYLEIDSLERYFVKPVDPSLLADIVLESKKEYSPTKLVALSTFIPGSGQFYAGRKSRGVVFLLSEAAIGGFTLINRHSWHGAIEDYMRESVNIEPYKDSFFHYKLLGESENSQKYFKMYKDSYHRYYMKKYDALGEKYKYYTAFGWGVGIHLINMMDALTSSRHFFSDKYKKPGLAAGLSAIPVLGLGQVYNGSFQKAGIMWTAETMLLFMSINNWRLAETANAKKKMVVADLSLTDEMREDYLYDWTGKYDAALKDRNTYLWYFVLFYFYGIFDAAVDAHLHDKALKIRLYPEADLVEKSVSLNLSLTIKAKNKNGNYSKRYR